MDGVNADAEVSRGKRRLKSQKLKVEEFGNSG